MKSKGLVVAGIVLIIASLAPVYSYITAPAPHLHHKEPGITIGPITITGIKREDAIKLGIFGVLFISGVGVLVKGFI